METQQIINILLGLVISLLAWLGRECWSAIKELRREQAAHRESLTRDYVRRDDLREIVTELRELLHRIWDRLDAKADKP